ncbi:MAG: D-alanine--D-alanine ligase [Actinomycetia bacterium]|nr:D-alanine--D-alanine ligase [Actinomycetes bacterium]
MARVLLLFGGRSSEHEVSCSSAVSVYDALIESGHRVILVGIGRTGDWYLSDPSFRPFRAEGRQVELLVPKGSLLVGVDEIEFDVAFPVLHGPHGEDGSVQGALETCDVPYVGCGVLGGALAMDKDLTKQIVQSKGIATAAWIAVRRRDWDDDPVITIGEASRALGFPMFVKPSAQGSSVGISRVTNEGELKEAVDNAFRYDTKVIIEKAVSAREIEVGVLDGPVSSVPGEVIVADGWYTYDAKYQDDSSGFDAPARLSHEASKQVRDIAERVFDILGLSGLARVDFFYENGTRRFLFNEVNTLPGFTSISGFPKVWIASGLTYPELCSRLVQAAVTRYEERGGLATR